MNTSTLRRIQDNKDSKGMDNSKAVLVLDKNKVAVFHLYDEYSHVHFVTRTVVLRHLNFDTAE